MKRLITCTLLAATAAFLAACREQRPTDGLEDLVEQVAKEGAQYTGEQWSQVEARFTQLLDSLEADSTLTADELRQVAELQARYAATLFKLRGQEAMKALQQGADLPANP